MHTTTKTLLLAGLFSATLGAIAQPVAPESAPREPRCMQAGGPEGARHGHHRPGFDKDRAAQHLARLKTQLALDPQQETAWQSFAAALAAERPERRAAREEMHKLSTPERLDKMQELRKQRDARLTQIEAATRTFYSQLKPEQQAKFDDSTRRFWRGPRS